MWWEGANHFGSSKLKSQSEYTVSLRDATQPSATMTRDTHGQISSTTPTEVRRPIFRLVCACIKANLRCLPHRRTHGGNEEPPDLSGISQLPLHLQIGCTPSAASSSDRTQRDPKNGYKEIVNVSGENMQTPKTSRTCRKSNPRPYGITELPY